MPVEQRVVVGAALVDAGRLLAAQRSGPPELAGLWEFPGGKVEPGEDERAALARECREELGVGWRSGALLGEVAGPDRDAAGLPRRPCSKGSRRPANTRALRWLAPGELFDVPWIPVDLELVRELRDELSGPASSAG